MSEKLARRSLLAAALALPATGCGFRPIYMQGGSEATPEDANVRAELRQVSVQLVPERFGQLLRRDLQSKLGTPGGVAGAKWELLVAPSFAVESQGIQRDGQVTRVRYIATANWTLVRANPREAVANGFERTIDAFNVQPNQFFASDMANDATQRRLSQQLAGEIVERLAMRFRTRRDDAPPTLIAPVEPPPAMPDPVMSPRPMTPTPGAGVEGAGGGGLQGGIGAPAGVMSPLR
ncbi:LPS assembly lipoprotein LptE [Falsiroseomonas sp. HW251]|uniref:LPS assembly lipoprotein LptE n=1 Tax=Falsiroseomonas sp. HW251 TaxID=3390998 RepID=UPI003D31ADF8